MPGFMEGVPESVGTLLEKTCDDSPGGEACRPCAPMHARMPFLCGEMFLCRVGRRYRTSQGPGYGCPTLVAEPLSGQGGHHDRTGSSAPSSVVASSSQSWMVASSPNRWGLKGAVRSRP